MTRKICLALVLGLAGSVAAEAQTATGSVFVTVEDASGALLPGARSTLAGPAGSRSALSDERGECRFLQLDPAPYTLTVTLAGYSRDQAEVIVAAGQSVTLEIGLAIAAREETVTVLADTPALDTRKVGTFTNVSDAELHRVPNSRDPWALLRTIPGVVVDRVNIAGNESGQQSLFQGKGGDPGDNTWHIDGVLFEDPVGIGTSPGYHDLGAFREIAVSTGGKGVEAQTGGMDLQFVVKRGTNRWLGSVRGYLTHDDLQWSNVRGTELEGDPRLKGSGKADHIQQISDYGFDLGGPIVKDKLFIFGSFGRQDIRLVRTNQTGDKTALEIWNAKLNWQISPGTMSSLFYYHTSKTKNGRSPGLGLQWDEDALWDQGTIGGSGPGGLAKLEVNHVFSLRFFANVKLSAWSSGFTLRPRGGSDRGATLDFNHGAGHGAIANVRLEERNPIQARVDTRYFLPASGGTHELKFGFGYKKDSVSSLTTYGGAPGLVGINAGAASVVRVYRGRNVRFGAELLSVYAGDVFTRDRLTAQLGLRFDHQSASNDPSSVPGQGSLPDLLPAIDFPGGGVGIRWNTLDPRLGLTYALGESRKTVLRASFARYSSRLNSRAATFDNPINNSYLTYLWQDGNGDGLPQAGEVLRQGPVLEAVGVDPTNPGAATSADTIDPSYSSPRTSEIVLGLEREAFRDFVLGAAYTWRRATNTRSGFSIPFDPGWTPRLGLTSADYVLGPPMTANGYTAEAYFPDPAALAASGGGRILEDRPGYHTRYQGLEVTATKRLSNGWMGRAAFSYLDGTEYYDGPAAVQNPTRTDAPGPGGLSGPQVNGGLFAPYSTGSGKGDIFLSAKWQLTAGALYQLPVGLEMAASLFARQGFARPIVLLLSAGADGQVRALATPRIDSLRYPNLWNLDLSLAKQVGLGHERSLRLSLDLFNVFNANTELNRFRQANSDAFNRLDEILSPRILRLGAELRF